MLTNEKVLSIIQQKSNEYVDYVSNYFEALYYSDIEIGDYFNLPDETEDGNVDYYAKLIKDGGMLYLIECDDNGNVDKDIDFDIYRPLNEFEEYELEEYLEITIHCKQK